MANYCFTKYAIEGKKEVLERVADAINRGEDWMMKSIENLGLKVDEEEYSPRAEWYKGARVEERDGVSVLFFTQAYPWDHVDVIDWVLEELGEPEPNIYMLMELFESGIHQTTDNEGKYFPERYRVWTEEDEDDFYFITEEEALAHIRKQYKLSDEYDTLEKIQEYCDAEELSCGFDEIKVVYRMRISFPDEEDNNSEEKDGVEQSEALLAADQEEENSHNVKQVKTNKRQYTMVDYFKSSVLASRNVILNGAIGTGKTLLAKELVEAITGDTDKQNHPHWELMVFTPSTSYEDFVEGLRPVRDAKGNMGSERKDGAFKAFCKKALHDPEQNYVFIIDNINHCNLTEVFGELVYAIEPALRGIEGKVRTRYQYLDEEDEFKDGFYIPENVYIIGTMNEIDHSAVPMDYSMRRRFTFKEVTAMSRVDMWDGKIDKWKDAALSKMNAINAVIEQIPGLNSAYHIGPSYFLKIKDLNGDWSELWHSTLEGLVWEYLRGMPDARERMQEIQDAYNLN